MRISRDIQQRVAAIETEMNAVIKERPDVVHGMWVARIGQLHLLMLGPGGAGKSFAVRELVSHITGAIYFETSLDENKDPGDVFGPTDIKAMVDERKTQRVVDGMIPEATDAFVDEIFNGNTPTLHGLQPIMNERLFHNPKPVPVPLRSLYAGTNKLNADADLAAFFDRLHIRYVVDYLKIRQNQMDMVTEAIARMAVVGRGTVTSLATSPTTVTLEELDIAHKEALGLDVSEETFDAFLDLHAALRTVGGIVISDRRLVEGMVAVLANAWIRGHETVEVGDLDILADMWWSLQDQAAKAKDIILQVANPGEKAALDLMTELDKLKAEYTKSKDLDPSQQTPIAIEVVRNAEKLMDEALEHRMTATTGGASTSRLDELIGRAEAFRAVIQLEVFGLATPNVSRLQAVR